MEDEKCNPNSKKRIIGLYKPLTTVKLMEHWLRAWTAGKKNQTHLKQQNSINDSQLGLTTERSYLLNMLSSLNFEAEENDEKTDFSKGTDMFLMSESWWTQKQMALKGKFCIRKELG